MNGGSKDRFFDVDCRKIPEKIPGEREVGKKRNFVSKLAIFRTCRIFEKIFLINSNVFFDVDCRQTHEKIPGQRESGQKRIFLTKLAIFQAFQIFTKIFLINPNVFFDAEHE